MTDEYKHWRARLARARHRALVWLAGSPDWTRARALELAAHGPGLWVGGQPPARPGIEPLAMKQARTRLGGEQTQVIFDTHADRGSGFDPDAFGALSGTVRAGGVLILLTPAWWGARGEGHCDKSRYLARLARLLAGSARVVRWQEGAPAPSLPAVGDFVPLPAPADERCLSLDQARTVQALSRLRRRRPLVITADRGRGKSAALGIAAAQRLMDGERTLWVTAPRPSAVAPLFERLAALLPDGRREDNTFHWQDASGEARQVRFIAPDALAAEAAALGGPGATLLVDEAAALPAGLLGQCLTAFPRIAFATTVHGYEGSGRGFALRFRQRLDRQTPDWHALKLATPVRWAPDDPLEAITAELLALDAAPPPAPAPAVSDSQAVAVRVFDRDALARDESTLRALFGLLVQAHYRTTPADLYRLLTASELQLMGLEQQGALLGVAVCIDEGGLDEALAEAVARGERRPQGHLLPQSLAMHAGVVEAATHRWRRIMRIAVHPAVRRRGLGRQLLEAVAAGARDEGIALLGASFGAEPGLARFWQRAGYAPVRLGLSAETSTGEHALMMARSVHGQGEAMLGALRAALATQLPDLLLIELASLDPEVVAGLLPQVLDAAPLTAAEVTTVERFAFASAPLVPARTALRRLTLAALGEAGSGMDKRSLASLVGVLWQGRPLGWLAERHALTGRSAAQAWLRARARELLGGRG